MVDLSPVGSRISIESPWSAALGDNSGTTAGADIDWPAYRRYGGYAAVGQVALFATQVNIASNTTSSSRFTADGADMVSDPTNNRLSGFTTPVQTVTINAAVNADDNRIRVVGDSTLTPVEPGLLAVSAAGSMTGTTMTATALGANIQFDGQITAGTQTYLLNAMPGLTPDPLAYSLSTRSQSTGVQAGTIVSSGSIGITMGNPSGGTVDLRTSANRIAFQSGSSNGVPYRYNVAIEETNSLQIDSVGSSSGPIAIQTGGDLKILGDAIRTTGDLLFSATGSLALSGSVNSANGDIQLTSTALTLGSDVVTGGGKSVTLRSTSGSTTTNALVRAGGSVKQPVAAASEKNYALTGLGASPVVDTVTLANNDRVLLKNQTDPKENGIYVFSTAGGGVLTRATDADSSAEMPSGFVVFVLGGRQMGAWAFRNPNAPQFVGSVNQSALSFVPATATQVYADVRLATTGNIASLSGLGTTVTADTTAPASAATTVQLTSTAGLVAGMIVTGPGSGIPTNTTIVSVDNALQITLSQAATIGSGDTLTFVAPQMTAVTTAAAAVDVLEFASTAGLQVGMVATGAGIPANTTILAINSSTQIQLSAIATTPLSASVAFVAPSRATTGNLATGSPTVVVTSVIGLQTGMLVVGNGIPSGTTIVAISAGTNTLTLSSAATVTNATAALMFCSRFWIDGVTVANGDRILVKDQSNSAENGLYVAAEIAWARASDADSAALLRAGSYAFVTSGVTQGGTGWALTNDAIQVGITDLTFTAFTQQSPPSPPAPWAPATILQNANVATTTNITLSGLQTIDGVALTAGNIVLVKNQTDATRNGLYTVASGTWAPVGGMPPPRGASVYVLSGVKNGGTAWQFNDSSSRLATIVLNSPTVTGLVSTTGLTVGMLVTGAGIPSGTTITSIGTNGTSLQLSANALLSSTNAPLTFTTTGVVTATTPVVFVPSAGAVTVTAATSIGGSSSLQGATALLTAGVAGGTTSTITAQTRVGRIAASAPAAIAITSANAVELEQVQTTSAGKVTVAADGTLTALNVVTKGQAATPGNISLTATSGDIVAESVTTNLGDISLASVNDSIFVTKARFQTANISTTVGNISFTANRPSATPAPVIQVDGRVSAQGTGGVGDITLTSSYGQAQFTGNAVVAVADTLKIDTRNSVVSITGTPQIAAAALDLTSKFGASNSYDPKLGSYQIVTLNRTDTGDIDVASSGSLTIRGATTVSDPLAPTKGSIKFQAPDITVSGPIQPGGTSTDIALNATAGDLKIDTTLTAPRNISLQTTGKISTTAGLTTPLLTAGDTLMIVANSSARVLTKVAALDATLSGAGAVLEVTEADNLTIDQISTPAGGTATITAGTASAGGSVTIKSIAMGPSGSVLITAYENILEDGDSLLADVVANKAELIATTGKIDVDTNVNILLAAAAQKNQTVVVDDLGTDASTLLELQSVLTNNADITITAKRSILATSVTTAGKISLTTFDTGANILAGDIMATGNTITLAARGSILEATPADPTADITATTVTLTATDGSIDVHLAASAVAATATTVGSSITIKDDDDLAIGDAVGGITGQAVNITVGGGLTQTKAISAASLTINGSGGDVTLMDAANDVTSLSIANGTKNVSFTDADDLAITSLTGNVVALTVGGALTQTGAINGFLLAVTSSAGAVTLNDAANTVSWLTVDNGNRPVAFVNSGVLGIGGTGITGGDGAGGIGVDIRASTIGVNTPITAGTFGAGNGSIRLTATTGDIWLSSTLTAQDDTVTLDASNGTITQTAGALDCQTLVWYAKTAPTFLGNPPNTYTVVSPNLTGSGPIVIGPIAGTLTVAGASTADGDITITGDSVVITGLVQTGGTGKSVTVTANTGGIDFQSAGRIVNLAGGVSLNATNGAITATNAGLQTSVTAASLSLAAKSDSLLTTAVGSVQGMVSAGNLTLSEADGLVIGPLSGNVISLYAGGNLTQTGAISAFLLAVTNSAGTVSLTNAANDVDWLTIDNGTRPVVFTDVDDLGIGGSGITGGNSGGGIGVDITATTLGVSAPITSGAAVAGNGEIRLTATADTIWLSSTLTAKDDTITLDASNGTIIQNAGIIDCQTLVWYAKTVPTLFGNPPNTYTVVSPNLTGSGPIVIGPIAGTLTVAGASTADGDITITGDSVVITGLVQTGGTGKSVTVTANTGGIDFQSAGRIVNLLGGVSLNAVNGAITATNAGLQTSVTAASLSLAAKSDSLLTTAVGSVAGTVSAGNLLLSETDDLVIGPLAAGNVISLYAGGNLTQAGAITAFLLAVTNTAGDVSLTNASNDVDWLIVNNGNRAVSFTDINDLRIGGGGLTGGALSLIVGGDLSQAGSITGTTLGISSSAGIVSLINPANDVATISLDNGGRAFSYADANAVTVTAAGPLLIGAGGLSGTTLVLNVGGNLTQAGSIVGTSLGVTNSAGAVTLTNANNDVGSLAVANGNRAVSFTDRNALVIAGLTGGAISLAVSGNLSQTAAISGTSLGIITSAGTVSLTNPANDVATISLANGGRLFSFTDANAVAIATATTLAVGTVTAGTTLTVTTTAGAGVDVGPQANGLLKASGTLDLRNVQGTIGVRNNGRIEGSPILLPPGKSIQVGGTITTVNELNTAVSTINSLPVIPGSRYEIVVGANMTLTQTLTVTRPISMRGTSQAITLFGSGSVRSGLLLGATAGNSLIRDLTFAGFADDAIRLTDNTNTSILGLRIRDSGYGLTVTGTSTGTVAQGNVFNRNATGVRLLSATGVLIGGSVAGQGNTISNASREGVFAQGFCTNSRVVRNTITGTAVPYNTSQSRNLTVVP